MLHDTVPVVAPVEPTAQRKKQTYGLSWLVSEPELELILWVMFGVALMLMLLGLVGLVGFLGYKRRVKKHAVTTYPRYYDAGSPQAFGIVAYDTATYTPGFEYEKLRGGSGNCYWTQRPDRRDPDTVRRIPSPQISACSPYYSSKRLISSGMDQNYVQHMPVPSTSYVLADTGTTANSTYQILTFTPDRDTVGNPVVLARRPSTYGECNQDVPCVHGFGSGRASLNECQQASITVGTDQHLVRVSPDLRVSPSIPQKAETFLGRRRPC
uniref:Conserved plasma membrane protein n=1 Tax=Mesocestoides corti TaxID=53468 RepID=A0A5K3EQV4_MESCO